MVGWDRSPRRSAGETLLAHSLPSPHFTLTETAQAVLFRNEPASHPTRFTNQLSMLSFSAASSTHSSKEAFASSTQSLTSSRYVQSRMAPPSLILSHSSSALRA